MIKKIEALRDSLKQCKNISELISALETSKNAVLDLIKVGTLEIDLIGAPKAEFIFIKFANTYHLGIDSVLFENANKPDWIVSIIQA